MNSILQRVLHAYFRLSRGLTVGVRGAVLDGEGRVFLIRHTYTDGWQLPGGGVETGETCLAALAKELREEACIELAGTPALQGIFFNDAVSRRDHVLVYVVRHFRVSGPKLPDREIAEAGFHPLQSLPEGVTRGTRDRLEEIATGRVPSILW